MGVLALASVVYRPALALPPVVLYAWSLWRMRATTRKRGLALAIGVGGTAFATTLLLIAGLGAQAAGARPGSWMGVSALAAFALAQAVLVAGAVAAYQELPREKGDVRTLIFGLLKAVPLATLAFCVVLLEIAVFHQQRADALVAEAHRLRAQPQVASWQSAAEKYQEACWNYRMTRYPKSEAKAQVWLGSTHTGLDQDLKAIEAFNLAIALGREAEGRSGEAEILEAIGDELVRGRRSFRALTYYERVAAIRKELGHSFYLPRKFFLWTIDDMERAGAAGDAAGQRRALQSATMWAWHGVRSIQEDKKSSDERIRNDAAQMEGQFLMLLSIAHGRLGNRKEALHYCSHMLENSRASKDREREAGALADFGLVHKELGELAEALNYNQQALAIYRSLGHRQKQAEVLKNIGDIHTRRGERRKAREVYQRALGIAEKALGIAEKEKDTDNQESLQYRISELHEALGNKEAAARSLERARPASAPK